MHERSDERLDPLQAVARLNLVSQSRQGWSNRSRRQQWTTPKATLLHGLPAGISTYTNECANPGGIGGSRSAPSQTAARSASSSMPFSAMLLLEPTVTKSLLLSGLAIKFLVQWWLMGPAGSATKVVAAARICVSPAVYGNRTTASVLAMYKLSPTNTSPLGNTYNQRGCRDHAQMR